jgi:hypothetical protein
MLSVKANGGKGAFVKNWMCYWLGVPRHSAAGGDDEQQVGNAHVNEQDGKVISRPNTFSELSHEIDMGKSENDSLSDSELEEMERLLDSESQNSEVGDVVKELNDFVNSSQKVFSFPDRQISDYLPPSPATMDRLTSMTMSEDRSDMQISRDIDDFMDNCSEAEKRFSDIQKQANQGGWSYSGNINGTPTIPKSFPVQKTSQPTEVKDTIQSVRTDLARILAKIKLVESTGGTVDESDMSVMISVFSALHEQLTPLSCESVDLKMAAMRLDLQAMEVQMEKFRDLAQQCRDVVDTMRHGYHISRTAYQVALKAADNLFDAYQGLIRKAYTDPQDLDSVCRSVHLPVCIRTSMAMRGCNTIGDLALMTNEEILSIPGIGPVRLERIRRFFLNKDLPALCIAILPIHTAAGFDYNSVGQRNSIKDYRWMAPKCYGEMTFEINKYGSYPYIYMAEIQ